MIPARELRVSHPVDSFEHGLPLGNGLLGAMVWGDGAPLLVSIDRTDIWDLTQVPEFQGPDYRWDKVAAMHRAGAHDELVALLEQPYRRPAPTKLPLGRIAVEGLGAMAEAALDRSAATASVRFAGGARLDLFIEAEGERGRLRCRGATPRLRIVPPAYGAGPPAEPVPAPFDGAVGEVWELGYPAPLIVDQPDATAYQQQLPDGSSFAAAIAWQQRGGDWEAVWTACHGSAEDAIDACRSALASRYAEAHGSHLAWWARFWRHAEVRTGDPVVDEAYRMAMYLFGSACRGGRLPAPLQGPWTSDNGRLPPWKGDYHHDLNTQMTYWPAATAGLREADRGFLDWLWDTRDACRDWTRRFFGLPGLAVPMSADIGNRQIGGWRQYAHSPSTGAWLALHFHRHWRHWPDPGFLRERAYPYLSEICAFIVAITDARDAAGFRRCALSSSPEVNDNRPEAWFDTLTNYDLTLFTAALNAAAEAADALLKHREAAEWRRLAAEFPPLARAEDGALLIAPGMSYPPGHRHFSHALAIYPLGSVDVEQPAGRRLAAATLATLTPGEADLWMGYSHAWKAALAAQIGDGETACAAIHSFQQSYVFPNGLHANGDWRGNTASLARFGAFTLEGNCAIAAAVHEMLAQRRGDIVRLFPAIPVHWRDVAFDRLHLEGDLTVSAELQDGRVTRASIQSGVGASLGLARAGKVPGIRLELAAGEDHVLTPAELAAINA